LSAFDDTRSEPEIAPLERGVLRPAPGFPQFLTARLEQLGRIAFLQHLPIALDFLLGILLGRGKARQGHCEHPGQDALNTHDCLPRGMCAAASAGVSRQQ